MNVWIKQQMANLSSFKGTLHSKLTLEFLLLA